MEGDKRREQIIQLNILTDGKHFHTVKADSEDTLDHIKLELKKRIT